ncbi:MAG: LacI family DNA-binding transcriptional regulator [Calditrichaceae bacterium]|nr:LacI family DNA-binding transcriptional regulator [Calditrichaceae bacterium]MBN2708591.1 LacI family DNA-binding transcriptional regulator [Calditrichaceae bacterium]RQV95443.1 MAG: LacI family transcriptional regulator [Calditrichota bacterium]
MIKSITINELAKIANVSKSTVSKALNDKPDIGAETKKRILDIVQQYDFSPHPFGKGLKNKFTENVGVVFCRDMHPISANPFYSRVLEGVEAEIAFNNRNLMLQFVTEEQTKGIPKMLRERQVDGLILIGSMTREYIQLIQSKDIPIVLVDPKFEIDSCSQVVMDNEHGAFTATQYLINMGHKEIGFISGDMARLSFKQRFTGFLKAMKYHNLPVNEDYISVGGMEKGYEHVLGLLKRKNKPTAIFSSNDINAQYGYKAVHDLGLKVPDDLSIVGFDDIELSHMVSPQLTTIRAYKEELGSIAVRNLLKLVENRDQRPITSVIPVRLIERESVRKIN